MYRLKVMLNVVDNANSGSRMRTEVIHEGISTTNRRPRMQPSDLHPALQGFSMRDTSGGILGHFAQVQARLTEDSHSVTPRYASCECGGVVSVPGGQRRWCEPSYMSAAATIDIHSRRGL